MARELRASTMKKRTNAAAKRAANAARRMTAAKKRANMNALMSMMERMGTNSVRHMSAMNMVRATQRRRRGGPLTMKKRGKGKKPAAPEEPFALAPAIFDPYAVPVKNMNALIAGMGGMALAAPNANAAKRIEKATNAAKKAAAEAFAEVMEEEEKEEEEYEDEEDDEEEKKEESDSEDDEM